MIKVRCPHQSFWTTPAVIDTNGLHFKMPMCPTSFEGQRFSRLLLIFNDLLTFLKSHAICNESLGRHGLTPRYPITVTMELKPWTSIRRMELSLEWNDMHTNNPKHQTVTHATPFMSIRTNKIFWIYSSTTPVLISWLHPFRKRLLRMLERE